MEFSIIVPAYNSGKYLKTCIDSVLVQQVPDWELILVDDGSVDGSADQMDAYAAQDGRIRVFHQENRGQFFARRKGIKAAKGAYLLFLDSDDELAENCLFTIQAALKKAPCDILFYTGAFITQGERADRVFGAIGAQEGEVSLEWIKEQLIDSHTMNSLCIKAFRRELFLGDQTDYRAFLGTHCGEDKAQLLYPITKARHIRYIPDCLYRYHLYQESTMHSYNLSSIPRMLAGEMYALLREYMKQWGMDDPEHQEILTLSYIRNFLSVYYGNRKKIRSLRELLQFWKYPWNDQLEHSPFFYFTHYGKKLTARERIKLLAAAMRL